MRSNLLPIAAALLLTACVGTEIGNPQDDAQVQVSATGYQRPNPGALTLDSGARLDSAWLIIEALELREAATCEDAGRARLAAPVAVDLIAAPKPLLLAASQTAYCRLELRVGRVDVLPAGAPAELADHALVLRGARADGTPFVLRSRLQSALRLRGAFSIEDAQAGLVLAFALNDWINAANLNAAAPVGGQLLIDEDNNEEALAAFEAAFERSADLFRDQNRDGRLQDDDLSRRVATSR